MDAAQARHSAAEVVKAIEATRPGTVPAESPDGTGIGHALYLGMRLAGGGPGIVPGPDRRAEGVLRALAERHPGLEPERLPGGRGVAHALFMARELSNGMSRNKSLRWLGYVDVMAAYEGLRPIPAPGEGDPMSEDAVMLALGRVQGIMVHEGVTTLESEKGRNLASVQALPQD